MTETAQKIMSLFTKYGKTKPGMVLAASELSSTSNDWGHQHFERLKDAMDELRNEGYVIITPSKGLELTEKGYDFLFNEQ